MKKNRPIRILAISTLALFPVLGCRNQMPSVAEPYTISANAVHFVLQPSQPVSGMSTYAASYTTEAGTTKFEIRLTPASASSDSISFGKGELHPLPGSDARPMLLALEKALEAKHLPTNVTHNANLSFTYAGLGTNMRREKDGGFNLKSTGTWMAMKIFLPSPDGEMAEVYLNLSPVTKEGEFSIKDADYGDDVLKALASVL